MFEWCNIMILKSYCKKSDIIYVLMLLYWFIIHTVCKQMSLVIVNLNKSGELYHSLPREPCSIYYFSLHPKHCGILYLTYMTRVFLKVIWMWLHALISLFVFYKLKNELFKYFFHLDDRSISCWTLKGEKKNPSVYF